MFDLLDNTPGKLIGKQRLRLKGVDGFGNHKASKVCDKNRYTTRECIKKSETTRKGTSEINEG